MLAARNYESALLHTFPALDATAKLRRPTAGVGIRFKQFIQEQIGIIAPIGLSAVLGRGCTCGGVRLEDGWYNLARNVFALIVSIVSARENQGNLMSEDVFVNIFETKLNLNTLWGAEDAIRKLIVSNWPTPITERELAPYRT